MESLMLALLAWIGNHTEYKVPDTLPAVEYRTQIELRRMHFCEDAEKCDDEKLPQIAISALFDMEEAIMFLPNDFNLEDSEDQSTLAHELIHYTQKYNGRFRRGTCIGLLEAEAYPLTDKWREEKGLPLKNINPAIIIAMSCMSGPT